MWKGETVVTFYIYLKPRLTRPQPAAASSFHVTRDVVSDLVIPQRSDPFLPISRPTVGRSPITGFLAPLMCDQLSLKASASPNHR
jgi:hypothetical protein